MYTTKQLREIFKGRAYRVIKNKVNEIEVNFLEYDFKIDKELSYVNIIFKYYPDKDRIEESFIDFNKIFKIKSQEKIPIIKVEYEILRSKLYHIKIYWRISNKSYFLVRKDKEKVEVYFFGKEYIDYRWFVKFVVKAFLLLKVKDWPLSGFNLKKDYSKGKLILDEAFGKEDLSYKFLYNYAFYAPNIRNFLVKNAIQKKEVL